MDLYIVDRPTLGRIQRPLRVRRSAEDPILLPGLLITPRPAGPSIKGSLHRLVDDVITSPVDPAELVGRVDVLLRARRHSQRAVSAERERLELLNTVAHELRTPLAAIKGFASAMLHFAGRIEAAEREDYLREISDAADSMTEMVENLLDLARLESGRMRIERAPENLPAIVESSVAEARRRFPDRVIVFDSPDVLPPARIDRRRIRQVTANLIENAVKYSPHGGEVEVTAGADAGSVYFSVTDAGIGIAPEHQARVFERYFRVGSDQTRDIAGTGLGLSICRLIVEEHDGTIDLVSAPGAGSTFTVRFPLS
jgi:signal transduction histidine kinase